MDKEKSKIEQVMEQLKEGVRSVFDSEGYMEYLKFLNKFPDYSPNNQMLIFLQKPDASLVAGYHAWEEKFNRHVLKGEKGITIIAPCKYKREVEVHNDDGSVKVDAQGNPERKEIEMQGFKTSTVFDVSQTEGAPLPEYISDLTDTVENFMDYFTAIEAISPVPVRFDDLTGSVHGYYSPTKQEIVIKKGMSEEQTLKTLCHEVTHARLDHGSKDDQTDKRTKEVEAESVAFVVCNEYGLDTSSYSFGYIAGWSTDKNITELMASFDRIRVESSKMINEIKQHMDMSIHRENKIDSPKVEGRAMRMAM